MEIDVASVKPTVLDWVVVGLMATTFIVFFKWLFNKFPVPGVTAIFNLA